MEFFSELLGAITNCISDTDPVVRERAGEANKDLLELVQVCKKTSYCFLESEFFLIFFGFLSKPRDGGNSK